MAQDVIKLRVGLKLRLMLIVMKVIMPIRKRYFNWKLARAGRMLQQVGVMMEKAGWNRSKKRQFWRALVGKNEVRETVFELMRKGL